MKYLKIYEEFVPELKKDEWENSPWMDKETPKEYRITPDNITELDPNTNEVQKEIFVFGSNLQGIHTKGAARFAIDKGWADNGQIEGLSRSEKSYAIPTQSDRQPLPIEEIKTYVDKFIDYAKQNKDIKFFVTKIGTGYSRYGDKEIAQLFKEASELSNVYLPKEFWDNI
jgi:hypothetical protein